MNTTHMQIRYLINDCGVATVDLVIMCGRTNLYLCVYGLVLIINIKTETEIKTKTEIKVIWKLKLKLKL